MKHRMRALPRRNAATAVAALLAVHAGLLVAAIAAGQSIGAPAGTASAEAPFAFCPLHRSR